MTKKQKVVFAVVAAVLAVVAAVLVLGIILSYVCYHFIYGTRITSREGEAYHKLEGKGVYSVSGVSFRRYGYRFTGFLLSDP